MGGPGWADRVLAGFLPQPDLPGDLARLRMGAHDAGDSVFIGDGDGGYAKQGGTVDVILGMRAASEEGEIRGYVEFGERHVRKPGALCSELVIWPHGQGCIYPC